MATRSEIRFPIFRAVHPGEVIAAELKERGIAVKDFAATVGQTVTSLTSLLRGHSALTGELAAAIAGALGLSADELLGLQRDYDAATRAPLSPRPRRSAPTSSSRLYP